MFPRFRKYFFSICQKIICLRHLAFYHNYKYIYLHLILNSSDSCHNVSFLSLAYIYKINLSFKFIFFFFLLKTRNTIQEKCFHFDMKENSSSTIGTTLLKYKQYEREGLNSKMWREKISICSSSKRVFYRRRSSPSPSSSRIQGEKEIDKGGRSIERAALFLIPRRSHVDALSLSSL